VAEEAGASSVVDGTRSLKAALDCDWDDPDERGLALIMRIIEALDAVEEYLDPARGWPGGGEEEAAAAGIEVARGVREQDVKEAPGEVP
jgi:hypothetical protein